MGDCDLVRCFCRFPRSLSLKISGHDEFKQKKKMSEQVFQPSERAVWPEDERQDTCHRVTVSAVCVRPYYMVMCFT